MHNELLCFFSAWSLVGPFLLFRAFLGARISRITPALREVRQLASALGRVLLEYGIPYYVLAVNNVQLASARRCGRSA